MMATTPLRPAPRRTCHPSCTQPPRHQQRGLSSLLVIAVLVMLGGLTTYAVGLVSSVHGDLARELSHARASQAAEAGLDWARFRISNGAAPLCAASQTINALPGTLRGYAVTVRCTANGPYTEAAASLRIFRLTATACNVPAGGACPNAVASADYVERTVSTLVER